MNQQTGILAGHTAGGIWVIVEGKGSQQNAGVLKEFAIRQIDSARGQRFVVDLSVCTGMDSTFMGVLTGLSTLLERAGGLLHVVNAAGRNADSLRGLGLDEIFTVDDRQERLPATERPECPSLGAACRTRAEHTALCLEAHEALASADSRNVPKFRDVIDLMRGDLARVLAR